MSTVRVFSFSYASVSRGQLSKTAGLSGGQLALYESKYGVTVAVSVSFLLFLFLFKYTHAPVSDLMYAITTHLLLLVFIFKLYNNSNRSRPLRGWGP